MQNPMQSVYNPLGVQVKLSLIQPVEPVGICWNCTGPLTELYSTIAPERHVCEYCTPIFFDEEVW